MAFPHDPNFPSDLSIKPSLESGTGLQFDQESGIETYGIAGRVWEAAYTLSTYTTSPEPPPAGDVDRTRTADTTLDFDPPCSLFRADTGPNPLIVEVGSGTGYAGIYVAQQLSQIHRLGRATVVLTDLPNVVPLLDKGLKEHADSVSGVEVQARALAWGDRTHAEELRLGLGREITHVLCSDLVYFPYLYPPLLRTLLTLTAPPFCGAASRPEIIIAYKIRSLTKEMPFWQVFGTWFKFEAVLARLKEEQCNWARFGHANDVFVFVATRRPESLEWDIPQLDSQLINGYGPTPPTLDDTFESLLMLGMAEDV